jgi:predicted transposase YdaD
MFTYSDLKHTRVYQDAREEGEQRGLVKGQATMLLRLLNRKFGQISPSLRGKVNKLSAKQLENLAEALFDLETIADLSDWLKTQGKAK